MFRRFNSPHVALLWLALAAVAVLGGWGAMYSAADASFAAGVANERARAGLDDSAHDTTRGPLVIARVAAGFTPPGDRCERLAPSNPSYTLNKLAAAPIPRQDPSPRRLPSWLPRGVAGRPAYATPSLEVLFCSWQA